MTSPEPEQPPEHDPYEGVNLGRLFTVGFDTRGTAVVLLCDTETCFRTLAKMVREDPGHPEQFARVMESIADALHCRALEGPPVPVKGHTP